MRIVIASFTRRGALLARRMGEGLPGATLYTLDRLAEELSQRPLGGLKDWTATWFHQADALVFVSAAGIAVRAIAPHVRDKWTDPAVVVVDEGGGFVIPLLSGHVGGANDLARQIAAQLGATPVLSTATDVRGRFAVDVWAKEQGLRLTDRAGAKRISAALLEGEPVGMVSDIPLAGPLPEGLVSGVGLRLGLWVTVKAEGSPFPNTLKLYPQALAVGVGCRKDLPSDRVTQVVTEVLRAHGLAREAVWTLASLDRKREDGGIQQLARQWGIPAVFYTPEQLAEVPGAFTASPFVAQVTGVENVCERAALRASPGGTLLVPKHSQTGVTVAVALRPCSLTF